MSRQTVVVTRVITAPPWDVWRLLADVTWLDPDHVLAFDPPRRLAYRMVPGLAFAEYVADVTLQGTADAATVLTWRVDVRPRVAGTGRGARMRVSSHVTQLAARLASRAEDPPVTRAAWAARQEAEHDRNVLVA